LSFPFEEDLEECYLGDIIISVETAARQAYVSGHNLISELRILTIHGTLHLLGHDHSDSEIKAKMWSAQQEILAQLEQ
jgi:probable rRNA maturation factor